ncbi:MAG: hypothetical protein VX651_00220, partial [Candidatus Neomarinimicrobiota bacterium]|nr:hypothetical protein [Candidatus Neomarinimicrobiota bacterium]
IYGYWFKFILDFDKETPIVRGKHDTPFEWKLKHKLVKNQPVASSGIEKSNGLGGFSHKGGGFEINRTSDDGFIIGTWGGIIIKTDNELFYE